MTSVLGLGPEYLSQASTTLKHFTLSPVNFAGAPLRLAVVILLICLAWSLGSIVGVLSLAVSG